MAISLYLVILLIILYFSNLCFRKMSNRSRKLLRKSLPFINLVKNSHRLYEFLSHILTKSGGTHVFRGPWFVNMNFVVTCDPANIQYILSKNFSNYPKGPELRKILDMFGDSTITNDSELWAAERRIIQTLMKDPKFQDLLDRVTWGKVDQGLIPFLENACKNSQVVNLQSVFQRLTFDIICTLVLDHDPISLCIDLPHVPCEKASNEIEEALFFRHIFPKVFWKLQRKLRIGKEKTLKKAIESVEELIHLCVSLKNKKNCDTNSFSMLTYLKEELGKINGFDPEKLFKDALLALMFGGKSTVSTNLTWFFWLVSQNPQVEVNIQEEIKRKILLQKKDVPSTRFTAEESQKLVYLHGALCESLRLYPPVPLQHRSSAEPDTLPSGHKIDKNTKTFLSFYSVGRMETIWGKDCLEFKPERWITETGGVKRVPFYKFPAFNGGPRTCLGINMAFTEMKAIAATIIYNYKVEVVEGQQITPSRSIVLEMKHGLNVNITKRSF